jgi:TolA-binding protein
MRKANARLGRTLLCGLGILVGCAILPPSPAHAQGNASTEDEYEGWLFKSLTGRKPAEKSTPAAKPQSPSTAVPSYDVQQTSANTEVPANVGPLIAGPSSHPDWGKDDSQKTIAGPPPTIPDELPPPPAGAVSIKDIKEKEAKEKKGFEISDLAPDNIYKNVKNAAGYGPDEKIARAALEEGKNLFRNKQYKEAAAKFATAADRWPDSPLEEDALFLQAESEFFADLYSKAHDTYGGLLKKYSNTRYLDTVMKREFALGRYWEQLQDAHPKWPITPNMTDKSRPMFDTFGYAVQAYERVHLNDPTGPLADDSLMALGNAYFRRGQYEDAAYNYDQLIKEYSNSEHQRRAHILCLQAKMRVYQGTMYVQAPLNDAQKLADRTLKQYGNKLGADGERVAQARAQIVEEKANREFQMGEFYSKKEDYGAARMYYQSVIDQFPTTERANESKKRLEAIRDKPDSPPNRFSWLTGVFDSKK